MYQIKGYMCSEGMQKHWKRWALKHQTWIKKNSGLTG